MAAPRIVPWLLKGVCEHRDFHLDEATCGHGGYDRDCEQYAHPLVSSRSAVMLKDASIRRRIRFDHATQDRNRDPARARRGRDEIVIVKTRRHVDLEDRTAGGTQVGA
jgi:hypothetical protein